MNYKKLLLENIDADFQKALNSFIKGIEALIHKEEKDYTNDWQKTAITTGDMKKYVKIIATTGPSTRVWGFIDKSNGDILKAASWKVPAKHARGNIYDQNPFKSVTYIGPAYLK